MRLSAFCLMLLLYFPLPVPGQRLTPPRKYHSSDDEEEPPDFEEDDDELADFVKNVNLTEKGLYLGSDCDFTCSPKLLHVYCNPETDKCECEKKYPVRLSPDKGCGKPKRLGDQCYYKETCQYTDQHSSCIQIHHNAICQCQDGYHSVSLQKPSKRVFCAKDLVDVTTNVSSFAGVLTGIAILSGLICFVLYLFNQNLYTTHHGHRFGNANLAPPILFSSDAGSLPMPIIDRSSTSRASSHRTIGSIQSRRASSAQGCRGYAVSASRAGAARAAAILLLSCHVAPSYEVSYNADIKLGSRRPSIASVHSSSSIRSYGGRRYEREREQKEEREMQRRLGKMNSNSTPRIPPTPSPHSTDDLLPTLEEDKQIPPLAVKEESSSSFQDEIPSTSKQFP